MDAPGTARSTAGGGDTHGGDSGDLDGEYRTLREAAGRVALPAPDVLALVGPDRLRFLNGLVTNEVKSLLPGQGRYGLFTQQKGRILAEVRLLARDGERLWLVLPPGAGPAIAAHLARYKVADRVEVEVVDGITAWALVGPRAAAVLATAGLGAPHAPLAHVATELDGSTVVVVREEDLGGEVARFLVLSTIRDAVGERLLAAGARAVGHDAWEALRIEEGRPAAGVDFGEDCFPQEAGLEAAVSFTKGCYLGQEVVARIHYRGGVQRRLRGLLFGGGPTPARGAAVLHDGRQVGLLTSVARSPRLERAIGLAILHQKAEPGVDVTVGGEPANVVELPFSAGR